MWHETSKRAEKNWGVNSGMKKWVERWPREEHLRKGYREEIALPLTVTGHRLVVKRAVKVAKRIADWWWGERLGNDF